MSAHDTRQGPLRRLGLILLTFALIATPAPAHADGKASDAAYEAGKQALGGQNTDVALKHFKDALALAQNDEGRKWQLLLAIALTYKVKGEPGFAIEYYRLFLSATQDYLNDDLLEDKWKKRRELAVADIKELKRPTETRGFIPLLTKPAGAEVLVNGERAGADQDALTPYALFLPPGTYTISVRLAGYGPAERTLTVEAGRQHPIRLSLTQAAAAPIAVAAPVTPTVTPRAPAAQTPPTAVSESTPAPSSSTMLQAQSDLPSDTNLLGPYALLGAGGAAVVAGVGLTIAATMQRNDAQKIIDETSAFVVDANEAQNAIDNATDKHDKASDIDVAAYAAYGIGIAAAVGGLIWMLAEDPQSTAQSYRPTLEVSPERGGAYGRATWRF